MYSVDVLIVHVNMHTDILLREQSVERLWIAL